MLTQEAIVKVNGRPVSDINDYMRVLKLEIKDLKAIWEKEAREMQNALGNSFKVEVQCNKVSRWNTDNIYKQLYKIIVKKV